MTMRYINSLFTYLLTWPTCSDFCCACETRHACKNQWQSLFAEF